jgi:tungstate transport system ATP-binding protein
MAEKAIELKNIILEKSHKQLLSIESLAVEKGIVTGVIGPNGAGKSTLLKVMALLEQPSTGEIYINSDKVWPGNFSLEKRRQLSVVFQQPLMLDTTVFKNAAIGLKYRKEQKSVLNQKVEQWLDRFGVLHLKDRHARRLSGGEAQRVALARAFVTEPSILFLDEPFSALDLPTRKRLLTDMQQAVDLTGTTTIFVSHDYHEISYLCNELLIIFNGKIEKQTTVEQLRHVSLQPELARFLDDWMTPIIR